MRGEGHKGYRRTRTESSRNSAIGPLGSSRVRENTVGTPEFHWSACLGHLEYTMQDTQKDRPLRTSFVKRRSSLVEEPTAACSRDTLHGCRERRWRTF
jgi:hypothetical protein